MSSLTSTADLRNFVNGRRAEARGSESIDLVDPATEEVYATAPVSTEEDVAEAYRAAQSAFEEWGQTTPAERSLALFRIADAMEARAEEFADAESQDTGKPRATLVDDEILLSVDQIRFFAGAARNLEGRSAGEYMKDHTSFIRREPIGVVGQVTPWNYPLNMAVWKFAPAIAAGNTTVLKPSDTTPLSTLLYGAATGELAGMPRPEFALDTAVTVVLASEGYPEAPQTGRPLTGLEDAAAVPEVTIAHAATARDEATGALLATGGRVLSVVARGTTFAEARERAYDAIGRIHLDGGQYRTDIAARVS